MTKRNYEPWLDVLRLVAMFFVVICHAGDTFNFNAPPGEASYAFWGQFWGAASRFCVPVFAMITGYLLLPVQGEGWGRFVKRRVGRLLPAFLLCSILYCLAPALVALCGGSVETLHIFMPFAPDEIGSSAALHALVRIPLNFCMLTSQMWYVYMLIGLYLVLPVFSPWYATATRRTKLAFLGLWGVSLVLPYIRVFLGEPWGECAWNEFGALYGFSGFLGYAVLGHVLGHLEVTRRGATAAWAAVLFLVGFALTWWGFHHETVVTGGDYDHHAAELELFFTFCSPNVAAMSAAIFLWGRCIRRVPDFLVPILQDINRCGYGIYCAHYAFIGAAFHWVIRPLGLPVCLQLPLTALVAYLVVWAVVHGVTRRTAEKGHARLC